MINWSKIKQIKSIHDYLKINKIIDLRENRDHFHDKAENHIFFFNKMFLEYLMEYMNSIEVIFHLKKIENTSSLSDLVMKGKIGFDVFHFFLNRIASALILLHILWKLLNDKQAIETYEYIIEVISNQIFKEYNLIKENLKKILDNLNENKKPDWFVGLLYFYTDFVWKNKKIIELYDNFSWFYKRKYIKMPILLNLDDNVAIFLNESLFEHKEELKIQRRKFEYMEKSDLNSETKRVFELLVNGKDINEKLLHSNLTMLNRLGDGERKIVQNTNLFVNTKKNFIKSKKPEFMNIEEDNIKERNINNEEIKEEEN